MIPTAVLLACAVAIADWGTVRVDADGVPLPPGVMVRLGSTRFRLSGELIDFRFTPDSRQLVGVTSRSVVVWNASTGLRVANHTGFQQISRLGIRPDGSIAILQRSTSGIQYVVLDRETGRTILRREHPADHDDIILSQDGTRIAERFGGLVKVQDAISGKALGDLRFSISDISPNHFVFSPDGSHLAAVFSQNWTEVREVATGNMPFSGTAGDADSDVQEIAFSADGRQLLRLIHDEMKPYRLESIDLKSETTRLLLTFDNPGKRRGGIVPSLDGKALFLAALNEVTRFDFPTNQPTERREIPYPTLVSRGVLSPDGKVLAVALLNSGIQLYDTATLKRLPQSCDEIHSRLERGRFVAHGKQLALLGEKSILLLDASNGAVVGRFQGSIDSRVDIHPDGTRYVESTPKAVEVRDLATHALLHSFPWETEQSIIPQFLPNGRQLMANNFQEFRLWNLRTNTQEVRHLVPSGAIMPMADGRSAIKFTILEGDTDELELELINLRTGEPLPNWPRQRFDGGTGLADLNVTKILTKIGQNRIGLFDCIDGRLIWQQPANRVSLDSAVFSPDGRTFVLRNRRSIQLREASTGKLRSTIPSQQSQRPIAFTPDGRQLATTSPTAPVYLWDIRGSLKNYASRLDRATTELLWTELLGSDAEAAFRALQRLSAAPETTLPFVREQVRPAVAPSPEEIASWIQSLDAPAFRDREAAMKALKSKSSTIAQELRAARDATPSPEAHERLTKLLAALYPETPESVRRSRIVELVEWCGTAEARQLLREWGAGAKGACLTVEAQAAIARGRE